MEKLRLYRFGEFTLSLDQRTLRRVSENISLTPKMYELLLVLVENPDQIVEKEFLLKTVWPDSFVEEGNITYNIRQLRIALGDDAQEPSYIETIPRRGYRFIAEVIAVDSTDQLSDGRSDATTAAAADTGKWWRSRPVLAAAALILVIFAGSSIFWFSRSSRAEAAPILSVPFAVDKLSTDGQVFHAVISPDGKTMVYVHRTGKNQSLWLRQLETGNNVEIIPPAESFYGGLGFSPDGTSVYFSRGPLHGDRPQIDIYRIPIYGGVPRKLAEQTQGWLSVSPDGERLSFVRCRHLDDEYCSLWIANAADGKDEKMLASRPRPFRISDNKISPDGSRVVFAAGQSRTGSNEFSLMEIDIRSGQEREVTPEKFFNINYIAWLPDQSGWLLTARRIPDKSSRIWHVSAADGRATMLTSDAESYNRLSLDAKGRLLVATRIDPDFNLNIYQMDSPDEPPKTLANASSVSFAPNGKIVYASVMTGDDEIWISNADGTEQRQLTNDPAEDIAPIAAPDGQHIYFNSNRSGKIQVWGMDIDGGNQRQITTDEGGFPLKISPDGQWLYYRSGLHYTLRRVLLAKGKEELVYDSSKQDFALAPDTVRIAYVEKNDGADKVVVRLLDSGRIESTFSTPEPAKRVTYLIWSNDGKYVAYILEDDTHNTRTLWFQYLDGSPPRRVADLSSGEIFELSGLALSYDSKSFAAVQGTWNHNAILIKGLKQ